MSNSAAYVTSAQQAPSNHKESMAPHKLNRLFIEHQVEPGAPGHA